MPRRTGLYQRIIFRNLFMSFRDPINGLLLSLIEISRTVSEFQIEIYHEMPKLCILIELSELVPISDMME